MGVESAEPASTPTGAVFLSYASEDAEAAARICKALRAAAIEVWFDQSELRGGDAWDQSIRKQIKVCALFMPLISRNTHERAEGYFRLEWKLAVDRSHLIAADKAFLVPVVIDATPDDDERVPERFRELQWTRLPAGETPPEFVGRVCQLLAGEAAPSLTVARGPPAVASGSSSPLKAMWLSVGIVLAAVATYLLVEKPWASKRSFPAALAPTAAFSPPAHSIAVLPFVNMSGDKEQEYFSDGLTEEILNSLARINELQVTARTSSFSFKGKDADLNTIAHRLNVASVLEGSVRRAGNTIRVTAQLNNAVTGFHLWSQTYDRDLRNVLQLQTDIADAVSNALKVALLGSVAARIEVGGTRNPAAFDAYLRALKSERYAVNKQDVLNIIAGLNEAVQLDPDYALAIAERSRALLGAAGEERLGTDAYRDFVVRATGDARRSITLAPDLAEGHLALAAVFEELLDFANAGVEYERALKSGPGNARVLRNYAVFSVLMGNAPAGITAARHAVVIDPINPDSHDMLFYALWRSRHYEEALKAAQDTTLVDPSLAGYQEVGWVYYALGQLEKARASCESMEMSADKACCLAIVYYRLGRHADGEAMLAKLRALTGDSDTFQIAQVYAQWGQRAEAMKWLEACMRQRNPQLERLKTSNLLDPLRSEPGFQAIERELKFPN